MTLTEQWKKGELEKHRRYYVRTGEKIFTSYLDEHNCFLQSREEDSYQEYEEYTTYCDEVLAPVPSYEEWQELQKNLKSITDSYKVVAGRCTQLEKFLEEFNALDVAKENEQLKTLLKEWMHFYPIILYEHEDTLKTRDIVELYEKTREVLKCKK